MSAIDLSKITLNNIKNFLKEGKAEIYAMLKDPKVADWQHINFEKNTYILKALKLPVPELSKTLTTYPKTAKEISTKIAAWNNEVGNQLADLVGNTNGDLALKKAQELEARTGELDTLKAGLQQQISVFLEANQAIQNALSLQALIPIAERSPGVKSNLFRTGLETLYLISDEVGDDPNKKSIEQIYIEANKLATRFAHIDMPRVPRLAEEIIYHHISLGAKTTKEVITFVDSLKKRLTGETQTLERIKLSLHELHSQDTTTILKALVVQATQFGNLIDGLYHKRQLKKNLAAITETLELLNIYQLTLKKKVIPDVTVEIDTPASVLNPTSISARKTKDFFVGAKGIIRSVKLMVTSLKGHEAINEIELQLILETALNKCNVFYGTGPKDIQKLQSFIHGLIENFQKPFPYNDLFALTKVTIAAYGAKIEQYFKKYDVPQELKSLTTLSIPGTFGGLFTKLKDKHTTFHKANTGQ